MSFPNFSKEQFYSFYENAFAFLDKSNVQFISPEELKEEHFKKSKEASLKTLWELQAEYSMVSGPSVSSSKIIDSNSLRNQEDVDEVLENASNGPMADQHQDGSELFYSPMVGYQKKTSFSTLNRSCLLQRRNLNLENLVTVPGMKLEEFQKKLGAKKFALKPLSPTTTLAKKTMNLLKNHI